MGIHIAFGLILCAQPIVTAETDDGTSLSRRFDGGVSQIYLSKALQKELQITQSQLGKFRELQRQLNQERNAIVSRFPRTAFESDLAREKRLLMQRKARKELDDKSHTLVETVLSPSQLKRFSKSCFGRRSSWRKNSSNGISPNIWQVNSN